MRALISKANKYFWMLLNVLYSKKKYIKYVQGRSFKMERLIVAFFEMLMFLMTIIILFYRLFWSLIRFTQADAFVINVYLSDLSWVDCKNWNLRRWFIVSFFFWLNLNNKDLVRPLRYLKFCDNIRIRSSTFSYGN